MKIRNGFVSNSSSSSFLLIGTKVKASDVKNLSNHYVVVGPSLNEGLDVFDLDDYETLYVVSKYPDKFDIYLIEDFEDEPHMAKKLGIARVELWDYNNSEIENLYYKKFKKECLYENRDYSCSEGYFDVIERHDLDISNDEIEREIQKYFREHKLERILKDK